MLSLRQRWIIDVLTVHLEVRIPEVHQPLTEDQLDWNWHHWKKLESLLRYPEPYYARELARIVLEINETVSGTRERLYGDQRDSIVWERVFHDMESAAMGGAFVIARVPEKKLPKLDAPAISPDLKPQDTVEERLTFIGVILKDQDDEPVPNSRIRIKLPDGDIKNSRTNAAGEVMVKGFALDGIAEIELLDFCDPGEAEPVEEEEQPEESAEEQVPPVDPELTKNWVEVQLVNEQGAPMGQVELCFDIEGQPRKVMTDANGLLRIEDLTCASVRLGVGT
jgi:hypothetical protein